MVGVWGKGRSGCRRRRWRSAIEVEWCATGVWWGFGRCKMRVGDTADVSFASWDESSGKAFVGSVAVRAVASREVPIGSCCCGGRRVLPVPGFGSLVTTSTTSSTLF